MSLAYKRIRKDEKIYSKLSPFKVNEGRDWQFLKILFSSGKFHFSNQGLNFPPLNFELRGCFSYTLVSASWTTTSKPFLQI